MCSSFKLNDISGQVHLRHRRVHAVQRRASHRPLRTRTSLDRRVQTRKAPGFKKLTQSSFK